MRIRDILGTVFATLLLLALMVGVANIAWADHGTLTPQGNCPVEGKVEDGAVVQSYVPDAGTHICIKGADGDAVLVTADGVKTIKQLLDSPNPGNGELRDVSHYTIIQYPTTTTSSSSTTSTTAPTTTTTAPSTTTTESGETTTTESGDTTTTEGGEETTTTVEGETTTTEVEEEDEDGEVLPFTGVESWQYWLALALSLSGLAALGYASRYVKE